MPIERPTNFFYGKSGYQWQNAISIDGEIPVNGIITKYQIDSWFNEKADKYVPTANGNLALLDRTGNLLDSGMRPDDVRFVNLDFGTF